MPSDECLAVLHERVTVLWFNTVSGCGLADQRGAENPDQTGGGTRTCAGINTAQLIDTDLLSLDHQHMLHQNLNPY